MRVCVVGGGGREHALARTLARSADVVVTPGNPGMAGRSPEGFAVTTTPAPPEEVAADLTVVGPEAPLVDGVADRLRAAGRLVVGPGADGARLEGSKAFMKEVLASAGIPTARYGVFDRVEEARAFLADLPGPFVVKTDGLAAGKGVLVAASRAEAEADVEAKLSGRAFGEAGRRVVVEEALSGPECSLLALCDGRRAVPLAPAQDFKTIGEGGTGPNTGGMGAYCPVPIVSDQMAGRIMDEAVEPLVAELRRRGIDYRGVLYAGVMLTPEGPKVLEFNARFGDPEAQAVLPLLADDPVDLLASVAAGRLAGPPRFKGGAAVCVVLAASGYPGTVRTGDTIAGLGPDGQLSTAVSGVTVFHGATARDPLTGGFATAGGRVLSVTAQAADLAAAREAAYAGVTAISFEGMQFRGDIAAAAAAASAAPGSPLPTPPTPGDSGPRVPAGIDGARGAVR